MKNILRILSTSAILAGSIILPSKLNGPNSDNYEKTFYLGAMPSLESRLKAEKVTFVIDPGHDSTYIGRHVNMIKEEELNLKFSKKMTKSIREDGGIVYMTRNSGKRLNINNLNLDKFKTIDVKDELVARANYIDGIPSDVVIIVHNNAYLVSKKETATEWNPVHGMEIYFCGVKNKKQFDDNKLNYSQPINCKIYSEPSRLIAEKLGLYLRENGIKVSVLGSDMKLLSLNFDKTELYIEMGYMTNHLDFKNITNPLWQDKIANLLTSFFEDDITYIKKVNKDYSLKKNLFYIMNNQKYSSNLEKMMNETYWK